LLAVGSPALNFALSSSKPVESAGVVEERPGVGVQQQQIPQLAAWSWISGGFDDRNMGLKIPSGKLTVGP